MTPTEADDRIIKSRQTLARYGEMTRSGVWPQADLPLMIEEVAILDGIADEHPGKAGKIANLVTSWQSLMDAIRLKMN